MEQYNFKNMKCIALTYNYDLNKLSSIGRHWAKDVYGGKNFIFEYSAASYATFIDKNPKRILDIYPKNHDTDKSLISINLPSGVKSTIK